MQLILVRHGEPDENHPTRPQDPPLNAAGLKHAAAVGRLLSQTHLTHVVSSPLLRALQTAAPLLGHTGLPLQVWDGWAEADRSAARYRSLDTLRAAGRGAWQRFLDDPVTHLGGDPVLFRAAVQGALGQTLGLGPQAVVAVFTHGMPINLVLSQTLGLARITHFAPAYGSLTRLYASTSGKLSVVSVNETGHQTLP